MIFVGDIASPDKTCSDVLLKSFEKESLLFKFNKLILNLEGLLADVSTASPTPVLFNHPSVIKPLAYANTGVATLANNHTLDLPEYFGNTKELLKDNKIAYCGAGLNVDAATNPVRIKLEGYDCTLFGFCWDVMLQHQSNPNKGLFVATINEKKILKAVKNESKQNPERKIILLLHWNLDLERIPFPIHREFGKALIDAGADAVIGSHSHCVQGAERYKNGFIVYGLGNFFIPWYTYINGTIHFPDFTRTSLALEWNISTNKLICHWFEYTYKDGEHKHERIASDDFDESTLLKKYTPYADFDSKKYVKWYKRNRRKGFLMPVYKNHNQQLINAIYDFYLKKRIRFARFLAKLKIRAWNN